MPSGCGKTGVGIRHFDDPGGRVQNGAGGFDQINELGVGQHDLCLAMIQDIGDRIDIKTRVDGVKDGTAGGHAEMRLCLCGDVGQHGRHDLS